MFFWYTTSPLLVYHFQLLKFLMLSPLMCMKRLTSSESCSTHCTDERAARRRRTTHRGLAKFITNLLQRALKPVEPKEQEVKEEQPPTTEKKDEAVVCQEELAARKKMDIFTQPSSSEFLKLLAPEAVPVTTASQEKMGDRFFKKQKPIYSRPSQNKIQEKMDEALGKEPRVRMHVPKPEPKGEDKEQHEYSSALDGLAR